jgi:DNA-binding SARP family transcriptional activator
MAVRPYAIIADDSEFDGRPGARLHAEQAPPTDIQHRAVLEFRVLGPVEVRSRDTEIQLGGSKQRTVLAALLLARGKVVTDATLSTVLWGEDPPRTSSAQIYTYVSRLRRGLGEDVVLVRSGQGYALHAPTAWFDLDEYLSLTRCGRAALEQGRHDLASLHLDAALALWRGAALGSGTEFLAETEVVALEECRLATWELRIEADLSLGRSRELISELTRLVTAHPLRERFRAQLMTALWRSHRRADALRVFFDGRRLLADELGVDPSPLLTELYEEIIAEPADSAVPTPLPAAPRGPVSPPAMLPADLADFTGRQAEIARLSGWLGLDPRLSASLPRTASPVPLRQVSSEGRPRMALIIGPPGVGKTALAVHVAQVGKESYPDGQLFVDLSGVGRSRLDSRDVLAWFLRALGATAEEIPRDIQERAQVYRSVLAKRRVLVVLENAASDEQVELLLPAGDSCGVLVTSVEPLAVVPVDHQIDLASFSVEESLAFLGRMDGRAHGRKDRAAALELVDSCGRLPLALRILGLQLSRKPHWSLQRMVAHLQAEPTRLDRLQTGALSVRPALHRLFDAIEDRWLAQVRLLADLPTPAFSTVSVGRALGMSESVAEHLLEYLLDRRLLEVTDPGATRPALYSFPTLTQLAARELCCDHGSLSLINEACG